jgi:dTDP-4-amino-4,6-dideoxygalactose transaminase
MEVLDNHVSKRRSMHDFYVEIFKENDNVTVLSEPNNNYFSNHWLSAITINSKNDKKTASELRVFLEKLNIESRPLWKPMHLQPVFSESPYYGGNVSEKLFEHGLCLPSGSNLNADDKERIKKGINNFFEVQ